MPNFTLVANDGSKHTIDTAPSFWSKDEIESLNIEYITDRTTFLYEDEPLGESDLEAVEISKNALGKKTRSPEKSVERFVDCLLDKLGYRELHKELHQTQMNQGYYNRQIERTVSIGQYTVSARADFECFTLNDSWLLVECKAENKENSIYQLTASLLAIAQYCLLKDVSLERIHGLVIDDNNVTLLKLKPNLDYFSQLIRGLPDQQTRLKIVHSDWFDVNVSEEFLILVNFLQHFKKESFKINADSSNSGEGKTLMSRPRFI